MGKYLEVCFRGENEQQMLPWRPVNATFECTISQAQQRFDDLVEAGEEGREIDGVVPYVVEIREVKRRFVPHMLQDAVTVRSLLVTYCEPEAIRWGPWAQEQTEGTRTSAVLN